MVNLLPSILTTRKSTSNRNQQEEEEAWSLVDTIRKQAANNQTAAGGKDDDDDDDDDDDGTSPPRPLKKKTSLTLADTLPSSSSTTTYTFSAGDYATAQTFLQQRRWIVLVVVGLLFAEYHIQALYYKHKQYSDSTSELLLNNKNNNVPKSTQFIGELELERCRFPIFFDPSRVHFYLSENAFVEPGDWRNQNKQLKGEDDAENVFYQLQRAEHERYRQQRLWRETHHQHPYPFPNVPRNLTYVHIGKAGGSTIGCNLKFGRKYIAQHCDNIDYDEIEREDESYDPKTSKGPYVPESAISRSVNCYTHWRMHLKCYFLQGEDPFEGLLDASDDDSAEDDDDDTRRFLGSSTNNDDNDDSSQQTHHHDYPQAAPAKDADAKNAKAVQVVQGKTGGNGAKNASHAGQDEPKLQQKQKQQQQQQQQQPVASNTRGNDYLVNLRSPVDRIASWFVYEHTENHESVYPDRDYHCGQLVLSSCYQHFEHLTTIGLSGPRPPVNQPLRVGTNLSATECSHWAWATIQGNMPADYHNVYNYDWYAYRLLHDPVNADADIFVLRVEHLEQDWTTVDKMLGGDGSFPATMSAPQNSAAIKPLRIANHNTTDVGVQNLCRALCDEIQGYKQLLWRAVNLQTEDVEMSMQELRQQCPEEVDIKPRVCRYD